MVQASYLSNGKIIVDGDVVASGLSGNVTIEWQGEMATLKADGSVHCQDVYGDVDAGGSIVRM